MRLPHRAARVRALKPRVVLDAQEIRILGAHDSEGRKLSHTHKDSKLSIRLRRAWRQAKRPR